jgi:hypothetical protein
VFCCTPSLEFAVIRRWLPRAAACSAAIAALAAVAVAPAALAAPVAAQAVAATSPIVIDAISSPASESGLLSVQAEAPTSITSLDANIYSGSTLELNVPAADFTLTSGSADDGIWTLTSPSDLSGLAFGTYTVTVDATDSGGDTVSGAQAPGSFFYGYYPSVTLSTSATTLSYSQQSVTFSGQVTADDPDDGTAAAVPVGTTVTIAGQDGDSYTTTTTDASGDYSVTASPALYNDTSLAESFTASVAASTSMQSASSAAVGLTAEIDPVQVTVSLSSTVAKFGAPVTLSGTALYQSGGIWLPIASSTIDVTGSDYYSGTSVGPLTATTDTSGDFSVTLPAQPTTTWTADPAPSGYLSTTSQPGSQLPNSALLTVSLPTAVTSLHLKYNPLGQLTATGCLALSPTVASFADLTPPSGTPLSLQYAASRNGPWRTLGTLGASGAACSDGTRFRTVSDSAPVSAYFRVSFGGQLFYQPTAGPAVHAATTPTRISGFSATPKSVSRHGRITVSGELERKTSHGWKGLAGRVTIYLEPAGGSSWYWIKKVNVTGSGKFRVTFAASSVVSAHWTAGYAGNATHLQSQSRIVYVSVSG